MPNRFSRSRLARKETQKSYKRLISASLGTLILIAVILFAGIPALVKFSAFLGDLKTSGQPINTAQDSILLPPRLDALPDAVNNPQIALSGSAQAGKDIEIILNNNSVGKTIAGSDGKFVYSDLSLSEGENRIRAYTIQGDKKSESSPTIFVTFKKSEPKLEVTKPEEGTSFSKENKTIRIEGQTDPEVSVTVNDRWAIVSSTGRFYLDYTLSEGENTLKIVAKDQAGNHKEMERKVKYSP